jgi:hypothetical protein
MVIFNWKKPGYVTAHYIKILVSGKKSSNIIIKLKILKTTFQKYLFNEKMDLV